VTLRIETIPGHQRTMVKLIWRIQTEHLSELRAQLDAIGAVKAATSLMMKMKTNSRTAKGLAICEAARTLTESSLKLNRLEQGDLKIMTLVILIDSAQMFFRNFGLRHVNAALGLAIGLAAPNARQKMIARFARPVEWLRSRLRRQVPETSIKAR